MKDDVEMAKNAPYQNLADEDVTEYKPINWKKIFLTPKYIRMSSQRFQVPRESQQLTTFLSVPYSGNRHHCSHDSHHRKT
jgi:hypothetical protein